MKLVLIYSLAFTISTFAQQSQSSVSESDVRRILGTLASDSMEGRAGFTEGNRRAANFIAAEFKSIGLDPFPGQSTFFQTFTTYRISPASSKIEIDGKLISEENSFVISAQETIHWTTEDKIRFVFAPQGERMSKVVNDVQKDSVASILIVGMSQKEVFQRYRRFYSSGVIQLDLGKRRPLVVVLGDSIKGDTYSIAVANTIKEQSLTNVIGVIEGKRADEMVIFSSHFDHLGIIKPVDNDSIANGADDDASGTTAVIELARYYHSQRQPERTLVFVTFTAEEMGGFGSKYFSRMIDPDKVTAMVNLEMLGKPSKFGPNTIWMTGFDKSNLGLLMQQKLKGSEYRLHPDPYPEQNLFYRSDNATLARLGVPAHTFSTTQIDVDPYYHTVNDEVETINIQHLAVVIRGLATAVNGLVTGIITPTRVNPVTVE